MDAKVVALMGVTGAGKSSFIKLLTGDENIKIGHSLTSETSSINNHPVTSSGQRFVLVDTPGSDDTHLSDLDVLQMLADWLASTYRSGTRLSAILYLHSITDARMKGSAMRNLRVFKELCGEDFYQNLTLATSCWPLVSRDEAVERERELVEDGTFWKLMISRGANVVRLPDDTATAQELVYQISDRPAAVLQIQRDIVDKRINLKDLETAKILDRDLENVQRAQTAEKERIIAEQKMVEEEARRIMYAQLADAKREIEQARRAEQERLWHEDEIEAEAMNARRAEMDRKDDCIIL